MKTCYRIGYENAQHVRRFRLFHRATIQQALESALVYTLDTERIFSVVEWDYENETEKW